MRLHFLLLLTATVICGAVLPVRAGAAELLAGFAEADISPAVGGKKPVYIAGYGMNRKATGVHDPILARACVLASGQQRIAVVAVDLIGLQLPAVKAIRVKLPEFQYVLVGSTHNHEGPDVIGIWGRGPFHRGVDDAYLDLVIDGCTRAVRDAEKLLAPVTAAYGNAEDETLLGDSRLPFVKDGVLRVIRLNKADNSSSADNNPAGLIVQWNCHPEALGSKNKLVTADFPWATAAALKAKYKCPLVYLSGAVGGLMAPPKGRVTAADGSELKEGDYEFARVYGEAVAALACQAIDAAEPVELAPFVVSTRPIAVPIENVFYRAARSIGVLKRDGLIWTGDFNKLGEPMTREAAGNGAPSAMETEVAYLKLGEVHVACIPGELYPELVYGKFQEPVEANADFPDAPLEPTVAGLMPGPKWLLIGLANDEIGYIIPRRQWDKAAPFAYGKEGGQYGEINSCGPQIAPIIMQALRDRVADVTAPVAAP
jgi:hypothetical protein